MQVTTIHISIAKNILISCLDGATAVDYHNNSFLKQLLIFT